MNKKNWLIIGVVVLIASGIYFYYQDEISLNPEVDRESEERVCQFERETCEGNAEHEKGLCLGGEGFQELYETWECERPSIYLLWGNEDDIDNYLKKLAEYTACVNFINGQVKTYCGGKYNDAMQVCGDNYDRCIRLIKLKEDILRDASGRKTLY